MHKKVVKSIAQLTINYRYIVLILLIAITAFFGYQISKITIVSNIADLLPHENPCVKLEDKFREIFGGSNLVLIQVKVKDGDIFNEKTLSKVRRITDKLIFFPGVDRYKVYSIANRKFKNVVVTDWGMEFPPLMWPDIPSTDGELASLKRKIYTNDMYYGTFVSFDSKAALISAEFFAEGIDYRVLFNEFQKIRAEEADGNTEINIVGDPLIYGYIDHYLNQTYVIMGLTFLAMVLLLYFYTRSFSFMFIPILSAIVSGIWGLGFAGVMGFNIDPLIFVVPLLITARALSHSIQFNERVQEEMERERNLKKAVENTMVALFYPGISGILTDAAGILIIAIIPIPLLVKLALICFFWATSVVFSVLFLNPVITLFSPAPDVEATNHARGFFDRLLDWTVSLSAGKNAWIVIILVVIISGGFLYLDNKYPLIIGEAKPGTPLLWGDSQYNTDEAKINQYFPGVLNPLLVVVEGKEEGVIKEPAVLEAMVDFQWYVASIPEVMGSVAYPNLVKTIQMKFYEDYPKWFVIPKDSRKVGVVAYLMSGGGSEPGDYDKYVDYEFKNTNVNVFCKDRVGTTIESVMQKTEDYIHSFEAENPKASELIKFKLAAGLIGLRHAVNKEIEKYQFTLISLALLLTAIFCSFFFWSMSPGILLILPLFVANLFVNRYMSIMGIGLNINTLPITAIAIGVGVNYGIYLLGRVKEEMTNTKDLDTAVEIAIKTTGKAITFTALTIILGVVTWIFSSIKFQAEMGILLGVVTVFQLLGCLIFLPALILVVKPRFLMK